MSASIDENMEAFYAGRRLTAKGRIPINTCAMNSLTTIRSIKRNPQEIDCVRLDYDLETDTIRIRADDSENLPFWCEIDVEMKMLQAWLLTQGVQIRPLDPPTLTEPKRVLLKKAKPLTVRKLINRPTKSDRRQKENRPMEKRQMYGMSNRFMKKM